MTPIFRHGRTINFLGRDYTVAAFINSGLSGQIYRLEADGIGYALKVFLPTYQFEQARNLAASINPKLALDEMIRLQAVEFDLLAKISHPNIVKVYGHDQLILDNHELVSLKSDGIEGIRTLPGLMLEFIDGVTIDAAVSSRLLSADETANALARIGAALEYLHHTAKRSHFDLKASNVMIRSADREPMLVDFSLSKTFNFDQVDRSQTTKLAISLNLTPEDAGIRQLVKGFLETNGSREDIARHLHPTLDNFQLGLMLKELAPSLAHILEPRQIEYLSYLTAQLTSWQSAKALRPGELVGLLRKLGRPYFDAFGVRELSEPNTTEQTIQIPLTGGVPITGTIAKIIRTRSWQRLTAINQLSLLSIVYPGANYSRATHVLYSYDIARRLMIRLNDNPLFRYVFDERSIKQALAIVALHDINHFPFLHTIQESLDERVPRLDLIDLFCNGAMTREDTGGSIYEILDELNISRDRFKRILFSTHEEQCDPVDAAISSLLNSGVDVDKLSYLPLDAYFSGVPYGNGIDLGRILKEAALAQVNYGTRALPHLVYREGAIQALENVLLTRYWNFRSLYWYHTNRAIMAMILRVAGKVFSKNPDAFREYIDRTLWCGDREAVRCLNNMHRQEFNENSLLHGFPEDRGRLFKRLYTLRTQTGQGDTSLYDRCQSMKSVRDEVALATIIARRLRDELQLPMESESISEDDVLVDVPRRQLDSGGHVYVILDGDRRPRMLSEVSDPVRIIDANYERLCKSIRFFVSPRLHSLLAKKFGNEFTRTQETTLREIIRDSLSEKAAVRQIQ